MTTTIELRTALPQPEQEAAGNVEAELAGTFIDGQFLDDFSAPALDPNGQRTRRNGNHQIARSDDAGR
jgi:hypothetical protein